MVRAFLLGVDGGGSGCRARLADLDGRVLGEGLAGPANIRFGLSESMGAVRAAADQCLAQAGLSWDEADIVACLALAGASEPMELEAARRVKLPFRRTVIVTDAHAACLGAHRGRDGGIIILGTGSIGWAIIGGREHRVGGWGFPVSDEGSGAWLGCEAVRRVLWAHDNRAPWTEMLTRLYERFACDPHAIVRWMSAARPRDFARLAPLVIEHAAGGDAAACELMRAGASHVDAMAARLKALGARRLALSGGIAQAMEPWLAAATRRRLVPAEGDALSGALRLARRAAEAMMPAPQMERR